MLVGGKNKINQITATSLGKPEKGEQERKPKNGRHLALYALEQDRRTLARNERPSRGVYEKNKRFCWDWRVKGEKKKMYHSCTGVA